MLKKYIFIIGFISIFSNAQEFTLKKTPEEKIREKELKEENDYLKFQNHFFKALQQKAKEDYVKAIESLEECNQIYPDNVAVNFEFSKNYLQLKNYENAVFFGKEVLKKKPTNIAVLEHLKNVYKKQRDFDSAIKIQQKIIALKPNKSSELIQLYIINKQRDKAKNYFLELESKGVVINYESYYRRILFPKVKKPKATKKIVETANTIENLQILFSKNNQYKTLKKLLEQELKQQKFELLAIDSNKGLALFPAQPFLYVVSGKSANKLGKYATALETLEIGLDFIIDNPKLEKEFYMQIYQAYIGLKNPTKAIIYLEKAKKIK